MACINPDGTLTEAAVTMMAVIAEHHSLEEVASATDIPLFLVRATARDLINAGLVMEQDSLYYLTDDGAQRFRQTKSNSPAGS